MRLLRALGTTIVALVGSLLLRLLRATWRVQVVGAPPDAARLLVCWHGDLLALSSLRGFLRSRRPALLISRSRDGELGARLARTLGLAVVRGSSSRGALAGTLGLLRRLKVGGTVALAADGPRGPRHRCTDSALRLARVGGAAAVAVVAVARRAWHLRSWDRHAIPLPFTRVVVCWRDEPAGDVQRALASARARARSLVHGAVATDAEARDAVRATDAEARDAV